VTAPPKSMEFCGRLQVGEDHQGDGSLRSSSNREHLVRGDISLLNEVRFLRAASSTTCEKCAA
jgi:hypothetical protein